MLIIEVTFRGVGYYAHPWGINPTRLREAEWPPSPWRLMRALVSAWYRSHPHQAPTTDVVAVIEGLSRQLPEIGIGKVAFAHTVHWQPNYGAAGTEDKVDAVYKNTRHENHIAATECPVYFHWVSLHVTRSQRAAVAALVREISYFGRAESICNAALLEETTPVPTAGGVGRVSLRTVRAPCAKYLHHAATCFAPVPRFPTNRPLV